MKIVATNIPADANTGLKDVKLSNLSDLVLLAGANGSGKTRLLNAIRKRIPNVLTSSRIDDATRLIENHKQNIAAIRTRLEQLKTDERGYQNNRSILEESILENEKQMQPHQDTLSWNELVLDEVVDHNVTTVDCVPKNLNLTSHRDRNDNQRLQSIQVIEGQIGISGLHVGALPYIKIQQDLKFEATHPETNTPADQKQELIDSYQSLQDMIMQFLGVELRRGRDGHPEIFGRIIDRAGLSNGQIILLQICVQIHAQSKNLNNLILFLDEPENHLHPKASIELIQSIKKAAPTCQLWIATHSLPILSYFNDATLLFVKDGEVTFSGSKPEQVLSTLLGDEGRIGKLQDFTRLPATLALNRYAAQCLLPPTVIDGAQEDDQAKQIREMIEKSQAGERKLKILDYGAGKGRLLSNLFQMDDKIVEKIDYYAYDPSPDDEARCKEVISNHFDDAVVRYFSADKELTAEGHAEQFDLIVMCNVLHEIPPKEWIRMFKEGGTVSNLLKDSGHILIVEDELIPVGEIAYPSGFIVFDTTELRKLFAITDQDTTFIKNSKRDGRLMAHLVKKECLERITTETRKHALKARKDSAMGEIIKIRSSNEKGYKVGRAHGFWVQQLANATLALEEL